MRPCQKPCQQQSCRDTIPQPVPVPPSQSIQPVQPPSPPVRCYSHPIRTQLSQRRQQPDTAELLSNLLEAVQRQSALLEELLRRESTGNK